MLNDHLKNMFSFMWQGAPMGIYCSSDASEDVSHL